MRKFNLDDLLMGNQHHDDGNPATAVKPRNPRMRWGPEGHVFSSFREELYEEQFVSDGRNALRQTLT
jgi:hypothetical protein